MSGPETFLDADGTQIGEIPAGLLDPDDLVETYRALVLARRFDLQAGVLARQGRLVVYPSALGQEACQVGAVLALEPDDWFFPTYRDSMAMVVRGIDPVEVLTPQRGDRHCGYDPYEHRTAPPCTPLATQLPHAVGLAMAARSRGDGLAVLAFCGDGASSEGDFHEALNFAAVFQAPVVFLVQNNQYAISVPFREQTRAASLAAKAEGYGMPGRRIDGNDVLMVRHAVGEALAAARAGAGPALIEAVTYRMGPHTTADDPSRYRDPEEEQLWAARDPLARFAAFLRERGTLTEIVAKAATADAEALADDLRARLEQEPVFDPDELFDHVYAEPTQRLRAQAAYVRAQLAAELDAAELDAAEGARR
ncbi:pyruvate dehydrogenase (acetyl-transferring) E1 component subunit alpha [Streptacidiphilus fuscans]|uniref:pyruvate dehydrogenase (acetyl-transferring) E1 component subunit alpha n=1 Tax=Streptacidiphilus fuscans TaxID=2789292 RepID=UPI001C06CCC5|nr:pyruvate dehydrogenase (acetyl-transferring) E1 component subunit alpha [Streptacidiphilus fuscans]